MKEKMCFFEENAFDILRVLSVLQVMFGHMVEHYNLLELSFSGFFKNVLIFSQYIPGRGVIVFFAISGFLVIPSMDRSSTLQYLIKKGSRIFPGIWFAFFINTFVIAILHGLSKSLLDNIIYFVTQLTAFQFYTGDWLRNYGVGTPNGSLWTITVLIQFYVIAIVIYKCMKNRSIKVWLLVLAFSQGLSLLIGNLSIRMPSILFKLLSVSIIPYFYIFVIGMFIYQFKDILLVYLKKNAWILGGIYIVARLVVKLLNLPFSLGVNYDIVSATLLSFVTVGVAYRVGKIKLKYELSYGIFIYHMIFVNVFVHFISNSMIKMTGFMEMALPVLTLLLTVLVSYFSLKFIEEPSKKWCANHLKLKTTKN